MSDITITDKQGRRWEIYSNAGDDVTIRIPATARSRTFWVLPREVAEAIARALNNETCACAEALYEALCGIDGQRQVSECMRDFFRQQARIAERMLREERIDVEALKSELAEAIATQGLAEAERKLWVDEAERRAREFEQRTQALQMQIDGLELVLRHHRERNAGLDLLFARMREQGAKATRVLDIIRENRCGMPLAVLQALDEYDGVEATQPATATR